MGLAMVTMMLGLAAAVVTEGKVKSGPVTE